MNYQTDNIARKFKKTKFCATEPEMLNPRKIIFSVALILSITLPILETVSAQEYYDYELHLKEVPSAQFKCGKQKEVKYTQTAVQLRCGKYYEL